METGSDSEETRVQLQRELTTHEKIYLHNIPSNPSVESDALDFNCDDISVPVIPLDVIDETTPNDTTSSTITQPLLQRDDVIGTAVALIALIKSKDSRNEIDLELLIQLLQNPGMLEKLTKEHGLSANQNSVITCARPHESLHVPSDLGRNMMDRIYRKPESQSDGSMEVSKFDVGRVRKLINEYGECLGTDCVKTGKIKDLDYYRRLVSQHGMVERRPQGVQVPAREGARDASRRARCQEDEALLWKFC
ncbi:hypothetical protein L1887_31198 [Cichorium endivia]|nr:hypothetical protein L1887_31198 [Cichorium endivia]